MSQLLTASINLDAIKESKIITGKKGRYVNLIIKIFEEKDRFGNDVSIEQKTEKGEEKIYLGNGRVFKNRE
jgi:hypothetical protein